jgi:hypothetical protein
VLEETMGVLISDDRERRPDGFEQGLSAAGLGLAQEAYTVEPTSYLALSAKFGYGVWVVRMSSGTVYAINALLLLGCYTEGGVVALYLTLLATFAL